MMIKDRLNGRSELVKESKLNSRRESLAENLHPTRARIKCDFSIEILYLELPLNCV